MLLQTPALATSNPALSWDAPERRFTAEASELPGLRVGRAYDDACDEGLTLIGRDGQERPLVLSHEEYAMGELLWTDFTPIRPPDARTFAGLRIFND
jgi:hypothetical protein